MSKNSKQFSKPKSSNSRAQKELDRVEADFDKFHDNIKELTLDRMNEAPKQDSEPQTKLSSKEIANSKDIYLKPKRSIYATDPKSGKGEVFNEKYRDEYNFNREYVQFIAENKEIGGESIPIWTKPYAGVSAEEWDVPVNKPVWGPRYLAEQIKRKSYHRLVMQDNTIIGGDHMGTYTGQMVADTTIQRLDAHPVSQRKSLFMGSTGF